MAESKDKSSPIPGLNREKFVVEALGLKIDPAARLKDLPIVFKPEEDNFGVEIRIPEDSTVLAYPVGGQAKVTRELKARFVDWVSEHPVDRNNGLARVAILPQENFNDEELKRFTEVIEQLPYEQPDLAERSAQIAKDFNLGVDPKRAWLSGAVLIGANLKSQ